MDMKTATPGHDAWAEQLAHWQAEALEVNAAVQSMPPLDSPEDYKETGALLTQVKGRLKEVDETRKEAKAPFAKEVKRIDGAFQAAVKALESIETKLKALMGGWMTRQREEQQRLLLAAQEAAQAQRVTDPDGTGFAQATDLMEQSRHAAPARLDGISGRDVWRIEVTDPDLVPREYCSPDPAKIKKAVEGGVKAIPGVRITADVQVTARAS